MKKQDSSPTIFGIATNISCVKIEKVSQQQLLNKHAVRTLMSIYLESRSNRTGLIYSKAAINAHIFINTAKTPISEILSAYIMNKAINASTTIYYIKNFLKSLQI
jgi:hypothetical protein